MRQIMPGATGISTKQHDKTKENETVGPCSTGQRLVSKWQVTYGVITFWCSTQHNYENMLISIVAYI